jgi:hypothetical protein
MKRQLSLTICEESVKEIDRRRGLAGRSAFVDNLVREQLIVLAERDKSKGGK